MAKKATKKTAAAGIKPAAKRKTEAKHAGQIVPAEDQTAKVAEGAPLEVEALNGLVAAYVRGRHYRAMASTTKAKEFAGACDAVIEAMAGSAAAAEQIAAAIGQTREGVAMLRDEALGYVEQRG